MNFIHCDLPESDKELFFGPLDENEKVIEFNSFSSLADIVVFIGKFPSLTQARKNGWDRPIPEGFSEHKIGKTKFWILNKF